MEMGIIYPKETKKGLTFWGKSGYQMIMSKPWFETQVLLCQM